MPTYEGLRLKVLETDRKLFGARRTKQLNKKEFTIISNNCWGGEVYEYYGLQKQSPTVGLFFMAEDYITFITDLRGFIASELFFISPEDSKWKSYWEGKDSRFGSFPIGKIQSGEATVEIFFLHYESEKQAIEKWTRRCKRINWRNLIVKFNDQNGCTQEHLDRFMSLPYRNKLFFTVKNWERTNANCYYIRQPQKDHILASYEPFGRNKAINITNYINGIEMEII